METLPVFACMLRYGRNNLPEVERLLTAITVRLKDVQAASAKSLESIRTYEQLGLLQTGAVGGNTLVVRIYVGFA